MKAIITDTETNGKIKNYKWKLTKENLRHSSVITLDNFPRITQLSYQVAVLETGEVVKEYDSIIKPDGWTVPKEQFFIENNISTERCEREGIPCIDALQELKSDMAECEIIVTHNNDFDIPVIQAEMIRYGVKDVKKLIKICTMKETIEFCKLPNRNGYSSYKYPKLEELYNILFKKDMEGAHDALSDVNACRECFIQLIKLNQIGIGDINEAIKRGEW